MEISDSDPLMGAPAQKEEINNWGSDPIAGDSQEGAEEAEGSEASEESPSVEEEEKKPPSNEVTIELKGIPSNARITVDNRRQSLPITLTRSLSPRTLRITAPGHSSFEQTILPYSDQTIEVNLQRKAGYKQRKRK
jgi:hypothetical protein